MAAGAALLPRALGAQSDQEQLPNIVVILADDMGVGDPQCYNPDSLVSTPNMDRLAREGLMAEHAYCPDAICTPTRYSLLTGQYCWRAGFESSVLANWEPPLIAEDRLTLPGLLKQAGYRTGGFGKWHLGGTYQTTDGKRPAGYGKWGSKGMGANIDFTKPVQGGPTDRGFDRWWGFICASEAVILDQATATALMPGKDHLPAAPSAQNLERISVMEFLPATTKRAVQFVEENAGGDAPFFMYYAPYVPHTPLAVAPEFRGKTEAGEYGDYVHELDHYIGVLLKSLEERGVLDDTLVVFASDNGSNFTHTGDGHHPNAPFRGRKKEVYEGGVRTPLIARWPGHIQAGSRTDQLMGLIDLPATCAALTGQELPPDAAEDSFNMLPALLGQATEPIRESIVVKSRADLMGVRRGKWKYIDGQGGGRWKPRREFDHPVQLYDLSVDPHEDNNLYGEHPAKAAELKNLLSEIREADGTRLWATPQRTQ
jgi:arylsulfatase A-like enzyme